MRVAKCKKMMQQVDLKRFKDGFKKKYCRKCLRFSMFLTSFQSESLKEAKRFSSTEPLVF